MLPSGVPLSSVSPGGPSGGRVGRAVRWLASAVLVIGSLLSSGCRSRPHLTVTSQAPAGTRLLLNGQVVAADRWDTNLPYYGRLDLEARPQPAPVGPDLAPERVSARAQLEVPPPASRWLFPFDFFIELVGAPWREWESSTELVTTERDPIPAGIVPPRLEELRVRARTMRTAR